MKNLILAILALLTLTSCGSSRKSTESVTVHSSRTAGHGASKASKIISVAKSFEGTRYRYGGTDQRGMDCSGLVYTSFLEEGIQLPRVSRDMASHGTRISIKKAIEGDLLFFQTSKNRKVINHVGIVVAVNGTDIKFIHSTTSRGVIVSSMDESYWRNSFIEARRII